MNTQKICTTHKNNIGDFNTCLTNPRICHFADVKRKPSVFSNVKEAQDYLESLGFYI